MPDIFISYSQKDRSAAEALARRLAGMGLSVWWDTDLVGGEKFREVIEVQLKAARAVVVLWSSNSVESRFVVDEADMAAATGKLVSVFLSGFKSHQTPIGFRSYQAVAIEDQPGIDRALHKLGILDASIREEEAWKFVLSRRDKKLVDNFIKEFPSSKDVEEARHRMGLIEKIFSPFASLIAIAGLVFGAWHGGFFWSGLFWGIVGSILGGILGAVIDAMIAPQTVIKALEQQEKKYIKKKPVP
jgi:hypothetical protein